MPDTENVLSEHGPRTAFVHGGPCGPRTRCWRPSCRADWGDCRTVEWTARAVIARCHKAIYQDVNFEVPYRLAALA